MYPRKKPACAFAIGAKIRIATVLRFLANLLLLLASSSPILQTVRVRVVLFVFCFVFVVICAVPSTPTPHTDHALPLQSGKKGPAAGENGVQGAPFQNTRDG